MHFLCQTKKISNLKANKTKLSLSVSQNLTQDGRPSLKLLFITISWCNPPARDRCATNYRRASTLDRTVHAKVNQSEQTSLHRYLPWPIISTFTS